MGLPSIILCTFACNSIRDLLYSGWAIIHTLHFHLYHFPSFLARTSILSQAPSHEAKTFRVVFTSTLQSLSRPQQLQLPMPFKVKAPDLLGERSTVRDPITPIFAHWPTATLHETLLTSPTCLILSPTTMASSSSRKHVCPHQCGCDYSATKKTDLERHISVGVRHRGCTPECPYHNCLTVEVVTPENFLARQAEHRKLSPATIPNPKIRTPDVDQDHLNDHHTDLGKDQPPSRRARGTYHHPQIQSLIAAHGEQLSSGLTDVFRAEVEREVKQRVSEVIFSEATAYCEQLRLRDEALLAAETRCRDLQEQLGLSNQTCCQLQERVRQLEATEAELRNELNRRLGVVRSPHSRVVFFIHPFSL